LHKKFLFHENPRKYMHKRDINDISPKQLPVTIPQNTQHQEVVTSRLCVCIILGMAQKSAVSLLPSCSAPEEQPLSQVQQGLRTQRVQDQLEHTLRNGSRRTYKVGVNCWTSFCQQLEYDPDVPSAETLADFCAYLANVRKLKPATICTYKAAVSHKFQLSSHVCLGTSPSVHSTIIALKRKYGSVQEQAIAFTLDEIKQIFSDFKGTRSDSRDGAVVAAGFLAAYVPMTWLASLLPWSNLEKMTNGWI
jgi:hypothetical protein